MLKMTRTSSRRWLVWPFCVTLVAGAAASQQEHFRERQVLDPKSNRWVDSPPPDATPEGDLDRARSLLARGETRAARRILKRWIDKHPDDDRYVEAVFLLGEAEFERGDFWAAFEQYEYVVENSAGELFNKSLRREIDVARAFLSGRKRRVWKFLRMRAYDDGIEILDGVWSRVPGTRTGEAALRVKADYFFNRGDMDFAHDEYVMLAREFPNGRFSQFAMLRAADASNSAFGGIKYDARSLLEAEELYRELQSAYPAYAERERVAQRLGGIRRLRADKDLDIGRWYLKTKRADAAEFYFRAVIDDWPGTVAARNAREELRGMGVAIEAKEQP